MLSIKDLPQRPHRKSSALASEVEGDSPDKSPVISTHAMSQPIRGRLMTVVQESIAQGKPTQIISISDLNRRGELTRRMNRDHIAALGRDNGRDWDSGGIFSEWEDDSVLGPKMFSDYMPDGAWKGQRCFIIGGGPSVRNIDLSVLKNELTIGINRAYELLSPNILFGVDGQMFGWVELGKLGEESKKKFNEFTGFKVWMALHKLYPPDIYLIEPDDRPGYRIGSTSRLAFKNNSGYGAINLAAVLGANPIYLLGFDMHGDKQGKQKWWHNGYPVDYGENVYKRYIEEITKFAPVLEKAGFEVVNLSRGSALKCFKSGTLSKVMKSKSANTSKCSWMVVSFFTKGTPYETEIKKLEVSLRKFNIQHYFFPCEPRGTWRGNLNYKSEIIRKSFDMFPDKDIVFIDSDGIVQKYPVLFDTLSKKREHDIAAHFHQYPTSVDGGSLLSGTLWFANNEMNRDVVDRWHKIGVENPTIRHQHCLNIAIHELSKEGESIGICRMPREYTQIFDYKGAKHEDAVIEHFQASRRFRKKVGQGGPLMDSNRITI